MSNRESTIIEMKTIDFYRRQSSKTFLLRSKSYPTRHIVSYERPGLTIPLYQLVFIVLFQVSLVVFIERCQRS